MRKIIKLLLEQTIKDRITTVMDDILKDVKLFDNNIKVTYSILPNLRYGFNVVDVTIDDILGGVVSGQRVYDVINFINKKTNNFIPGLHNNEIEFYVEDKISDKIYDKFFQTDYIVGIKDNLDELGIENIEDYFYDFDGKKSLELEKEIKSKLIIKNNPIQKLIENFLQSKTDIPLKFEYKLNNKNNEVKLKILPQISWNDFISCKYKKWPVHELTQYVRNLEPSLQEQINEYVGKILPQTKPILVSYEIILPRDIGVFVVEQNKKIRDILPKSVLDNVSVVIEYTTCINQPKFIIGYPTQPGGNWGETKKYINVVVEKLKSIFSDEIKYVTSNYYWDIKKKYLEDDKRYWSKEKLFNFFVNSAINQYGNIYEYDIERFDDLNSLTEVFCKKHQRWFEVIPNEHIGGKRCPFDNESKGESMVRVYLEKNDIPFKQYHKLKGCFSEINGRCILLTFDFYLPEQNTVIEYDGEQHFKPIERFGGEETYKRQLILDNIKNVFCERSGINMIRIPYTIKKPKDIIELLNNRLN